MKEDNVDGWSPIKTVPCLYDRRFRRSDGKYVAHDVIPHLCHIEMTYACNARCIFCYNPERAKLGDLSVIDRIVQSVVRSQIPHVYLIGGEPSLLPVTKLNEYIEALSPYSSVTIVTNGIVKLEGISDKLACFGVPIHGANAEMHEFLNRAKGSFGKTLDTIRHYVARGHDVRCIPVLTGYNHNQMYDIIGLASDLGMESVFVDRYEDGGLGASLSAGVKLKPSKEQFREAMTQIIQAKKDFVSFGGRIGFGTAIPYCLDERMVTEGLTSDCGVGSSFCAVNPKGEFRLCNQSQLVFGNVLEEPIEAIWNKKSLDIFRDLSWVGEPCKSCELLLDCTGGCKVDANCSDKFCIDYAVRGLSGPTAEYVRKLRKPTLSEDVPMEYRQFKVNRYTKANIKHEEKFLVTRYQTVKIDEVSLDILSVILDGNIRDERALVVRFADKIDEVEIRKFVSGLIQIGAIDPVGEVQDEGS